MNLVCLFAPYSKTIEEEKGEGEPEEEKEEVAGEAVVAMDRAE